MSNISPLDSRYKKQVSELNEYFSEQALMGFRLYVEIKYLIFLSKHRALKKLISLNRKDQQKLEKIYSNFDQKEYNAIKRIEARTKHDVNAVVQYLSKKIEKLYDLIVKEGKSNLDHSALYLLIKKLKR